MEAGFIPVGSISHTGTAPGVGSSVPPAGRIIRAPGLKRGKNDDAINDRIKLESVYGLTVNTNAALDCDPNTELVAYPAGCTVVLYNVRKNRQSHVLNASRKSVTCVAFSPDGRYLATGECGHAPAVRVWDLQDQTSASAVQIAEFPSHTHGVSCVAFSVSSKYLVSIGTQHDMIVNVWDWRANKKLASNKVSSRVMAVSFAENGSYFVTVGFRHVKFWYLEYSRSSKFEPVPLMGRSAILGELKDNEFCDVRCGRGAAASQSTYAITRSGLLCEFNSRRLLDKWVELRTTSANCMAIGSQYIFVGCAEGIVRCFSPHTLQFVTTLPRTHYLGVDVSQGVNISHMFGHPERARYPDAIAITYDERNHKLTTVYNDHSLYVWDVRDIKRVGKSHSALYHSACIWGVDMMSDGTFLTCSSDDTVRLWTVNNDGLFDVNIYSNELHKVLYIDPELSYLKDVDLTTATEKDKAKSYDDKTGVRCVRVSPDCKHIASGDRSGNIWVHAAASGTCLLTLEAHDAEVLCLEYSNHTAGPRLLASGSRDRLVHVFNVEKGYEIMQTLDDHSSSITAVRLLSSSAGLQMVSCGADKTILFRQLVQTGDGSYQFTRGHNASTRCTLYDMEIDAGARHVLTACQDRNVRVYSSSNARHTKTFRATVAEEGTLIKVALDNSGIYLATSSTDKILCVYDYYSGECMATVFGHSEIVTGLRFTPDCQHLISASGDGCIFIWRVPHDMVVTMKARLAQQAIRQGRKVTNGATSGLDSESDSHFGSPPRELGFDGPRTTVPEVPDYTLRIGRLPSWAKKSLGDELTNVAQSPGHQTPDPPSRGKWARRINGQDRRPDSEDGSKDSSLDSGTDTRYIERRKEGTSLSKQSRPRSLNLSQLPRVEALFRSLDQKIKSTYDILTLSPRGNKVVINAGIQRIRHHTDDSSLGSFKYEDQESTEHDGDIEDMSDGERTSSSERNVNRKTYYPGNNDDNTPGEFMVNAMDVEELRKSVRRSKRWKNEDTPPVLTATSVSGSGPDTDDDDDASTPSGDNAERTILTPATDDVSGRRGNLIKSAYDNLSGAELDAGTNGNKSLSSQHRSPPKPMSKPVVPQRSSLKTSSVVDTESARKREELNRRILETRRQLESVGFRSNLKSSQSTTDLSYVHDGRATSQQAARARPVSMASGHHKIYAGRNTLTPSDAMDEAGGLRRAISLSDLVVVKPSGNNTRQAQTKVSSQQPPAVSAKPSSYVRPSPRHTNNTNKTNMTRSSSVGVLNQSDSDGEQNQTARRPAAADRSISALMRPTISSMNKSCAGAARRRGLQSAYSSVNLSTVGGDGSSSDGEGAGDARIADRRTHGRMLSERDMSAKAREVTARLTAGTNMRSVQQEVTAGPQELSASRICASLTQQLTHTAAKVVQLYKALQGSEPGNRTLITGLESAIMETQNVLRSVVGDTTAGHADTQRLQELINKGAFIGSNPSVEQNAAMSMIEQYSDILLNMMQSKMSFGGAGGGGGGGGNPQSLPPSVYKQDKNTGS